MTQAEREELEKRWDELPLARPHRAPAPLSWGVFDVLPAPDARLRKAAEDALIGINTVDVAEKLIRTMVAMKGIGFAAPQVGHFQRLVVVKTAPSDGPTLGGPVVLLNPWICAFTGREKSPEGCFSLPHYTTLVDRARKVQVIAQDLEGRWVRLSAQGRLAHCVQHELDHLDGVLIDERARRDAHIRAREAR